MARVELGSGPLPGPGSGGGVAPVVGSGLVEEEEEGLTEGMMGWGMGVMLAVFLA